MPFDRDAHCPESGLQRALRMGSMDAGLMRLIKQEWKMHLDWRELLRQFFEQCADNDYSWTVPNATPLVSQETRTTCFFLKVRPEVESNSANSSLLTL